MITKELLSEVLGVYKIIEPYGNILVWEWDKSYSNNNCSINIYELAHKCKEWALQYDYTILSSKGYATISGKVFYDKTEPEAIFKACQWILENKDK